MKKRLTFAGLLFFSSLITVLGQNSTILPGIVLPQMTTAQRMAINSPQNGMLVFDTNTQGYWFRQNGVWVNMSTTGGGSSFWQLNGIGGNEIRTTNTGGFWSAHSVDVPGYADNTTNPPTAPVNGIGTRLMWIPSRSAFRVGTVFSTRDTVWDANNIGLFSFATGYNTMANGRNSTALGQSTTANGDFSLATGNGSIAGGNYSTAMGIWTSANGEASVAMGSGTAAGGNYSTAMGRGTIASNYYSTAMGVNTTASAWYSTAMGHNTEASGEASTAMGVNTIASGGYSTVMGLGTEASGWYSTAMGSNTTASAIYSTAMGSFSTASGSSSTAIGHAAKASGEYSIAMGRFTNTNEKRGSFIIGDADPFLQGESIVGIENQFVGRFANGYWLMTCGNSGNGNPSNGVRTGIRAGAGANAWSSISDSTKKEKHQLIDGEGLLQKIAKFRLTTWNYKGQDPKIFRHYGPMAQDFYAAFGKDNYGSIGCDTLINQADFDGINFTAIQVLVKRTDELTRANEELKSKNEALEKRLTRMENEWADLKQALARETAVRNKADASTTTVLIGKNNQD